MRCPGLRDLPAPPPGKTGWPWTEETPAERVADATSSVSIVTPSYNQASYLEETIRSVLLQGHPKLEYIVIDGGSSDGSIDIIRRYEPWLKYWVSETDHGQSDAVNKGFERAEGEILGWINSDDIYATGALRRVSQYFRSEPTCELAYGNGYYLDAVAEETNECDWVRPFDGDLLLTFNFILQPAAFWRRSLWERIGCLNVDYHWAMDWDWFIRATRNLTPHYLPNRLAGWRMIPESKTATGGIARRAELAQISWSHGGAWQPTYLAYQLDRFAEWLVRSVPFGDFLKYAVIGTRRTLQETVWRQRCLF